jgi:hypothetical protein
MQAHISELEKKYFNPDQGIICCHGEVECDTLQTGHLYRTFYINAKREWFTSGCTLRQIVDSLKPVTAIDFPTRGCHCRFRLYHSQCSWVPKLLKDVEDTIASVEGLSYSEFASRTCAPVSCRLMALIMKGNSVAGAKLEP